MAEMHESSSRRKAKVQRVKALDWGTPGETILMVCEPAVQWFDQQGKERTTSYIVVSSNNWGSGAASTTIFPAHMGGELQFRWRPLLELVGEADRDKAVRQLMYKMMEAQR